MNFARALSFLIGTLVDLYTTAVMLRLLLQWVRADFYNPVCQFLIKITNPLLIPIRRMVPSIGRLDTASLVLMFISIKYLDISVGGLFSPEYAESAWSPGKVWDLIKHLWIPITILVFTGTAWLTRVMRGNLLDILNMQYVQTARAKGLSERIVNFVHAGRNALIPIATILGRQITGLLGGAVITETIWSWPGLGRMFVEANFKRDYPVVLAGFVIGTIAVILGNMLSDIFYAIVDPRIRLGLTVYDPSTSGGNMIGSTLEHPATASARPPPAITRGRSASASQPAASAST